MKKKRILGFSHSFLYKSFILNPPGNSELYESLDISYHSFDYRCNLTLISTLVWGEKSLIGNAGNTSQVGEKEL